MKLLIGRSSTPGLLAFSKGGGAYCIRRKWIVNCSPTLKMDDGDSLDEWANIAYVLSKQLWKLELSVRMRMTPDSDSANVFLGVDTNVIRKLNKCIQLFNPTLRCCGCGNCGEFILHIGTRQIPFKGGFWCNSLEGEHTGEYSKTDYERDVKLTSEEANLMCSSKDNSISFLINFGPKTPVALDVNKRILESGFVYDYPKVGSRDDGMFPVQSHSIKRR